MYDSDTYKPQRRTIFEHSVLYASLTKKSQSNNSKMSGNNCNWLENYGNSDILGVCLPYRETRLKWAPEFHVHPPKYTFTSKRG